MIFKEFRKFSWKPGVLETINKYYRRVSSIFYSLAHKNLFCQYRKGYKYPLWGRYGTSDKEAIQDTFVKQEISCLSDIKDPKLIIDCGAYVGYTVVWFLNKFPNVYVIATEPCARNFAICRKNLRPYGKRVSLIHAGVWTHKTGLVLCRGQYRDEKDWATQVRECQTGEKPEVYAIDIYSLLQESGFEYIDILKINIERAEAIIFSQNYEKWLNRVKNIYIELHDKECKEIFFRSLSGYSYELAKSCDEEQCWALVKNISPKGTIKT